MGILIVLALVALVVILWFVRTYNNFISLREKLKNSKSQIAVQMESRWDALTNLIAATEKYSSYEKNTFKEIVDQRTRLSANADIGQIERAESQYAKAFSSLIALAENYPDLKASEIYKSTMDSVNSYEDKVRFARMTFNDSATMYNRTRQQVPANIVASIMGLEEEKYFELSENKNEMPKWS